MRDMIKNQKTGQTGEIMGKTPDGVTVKVDGNITWWKNADIRTLGWDYHEDPSTEYWEAEGKYEYDYLIEHEKPFGAYAVEKFLKEDASTVETETVYDQNEGFEKAEEWEDEAAPETAEYFLKYVAAAAKVRNYGEYAHIMEGLDQADKLQGDKRIALLEDIEYEIAVGGHKGKINENQEGTLLRIIAFMNRGMSLDATLRYPGLGSGGAFIANPDVKSLHLEFRTPTGMAEEFMKNLLMKEYHVSSATHVLDPDYTLVIVNVPIDDTGMFDNVVEIAKNEGIELVGNLSAWAKYQRLSGMVFTPESDEAIKEGSAHHIDVIGWLLDWSQGREIPSNIHILDVGDAAKFANKAQEAGYHVHVEPYSTYSAEKGMAVTGYSVAVNER